MKKILLAVIFLGVSPVCMKAQAVISVHSKGKVASVSTLSDAMAIAKANDTINLPAGEIQMEDDWVFDKGVHVFGVGYQPNSNALNQTTRLTAKRILVKEGAQSGSISGVILDGDLLFINSGSVKVSQFEVSRCNFQNLIFGNSFTGITIRENVIRDITGAPAISYSLKNNIITGILTGIHSIPEIENNIFLNSGFEKPLLNECSSINLRYNIVLAKNLVDQTSVLIQCDNNVFTTALPLNKEIIKFGNLENVPINAIFDESVLSGFNYQFNFNANYHLIESSPALQGNFKYSQPGIYGGSQPAKLLAVPSQPQIYDFKMQEMPDKNDKLKLNVTIKAQQN